MIFYPKYVNDNKILNTTDERFYFIIILILCVFFTIAILAISHIWFPYPTKELATLIDLFRRFMITFFTLITFFYAFYVIQFRKGHWWLFPVAIFLAFAFSPLTQQYISEVIEDCNYVTFDEAIIGGCYIYDNYTINNRGYENIHMVIMKGYDRWKAQYPIKFVLEFNESKYKNCRIDLIDWRKNTHPNITYINNSNCSIIVYWLENELGYQETAYVSNWWVDFLVSWDYTNKTVIKPDKYEILIEYIGWIDVCKGIFCYHLDNPNWYSKTSWEQINNPAFIEKYIY